MGKTHLARDVCKEPPSRPLVWISLSGFSSESEMVQHLDDQICVHLMQITGDNSWWAAHRAIGSSVTGMMETMVRGLGHGGLLVVDDVPDLVNNTRISARLQDLAMACSENDVTILTTGQRKIPPQSSAILPPERMKQESVPPMSPPDVLEMLRVAGAPPAFLVPSLAELIEAPTHGHPSLISGVIVWLEQRSWVMEEKGLLDILTGAATADVQETAARRMVALIPHEAQKEMLCRLALIRRTFDRKAADVVASAAPPLARPGELLTELVGPWINRLDDDKFEVSPLVASAGYLYLARDEQQRIHAELADHILAQRTLSIDQALPAIIHLLAAERWLQLGAVLVQALASAKTSAQAQQLGLLRLIFPPPSAWPSEMPLSMRIMIRAQQIRVARLASEDAEDLNRDLDSLLQVVSDKPDEAAALVYAQMHTGVLLRQTPTAERVRKAIQVVRMIRKYPELFSTVPGVRVGTGDYVWLAASDLKGVEDVDAIVEGLATLELEELKIVFQSDLSLQMSQIMADKCWADMSGRSEREQDWDGVLATITKLEDLARMASSEGLRVSALRARAITLADYLNRSEDALTLLRTHPEPTDPDLLFLYRYTIARILEDKGDLEEAVSEYERAIAAVGREFSYFRFSAYASAAEVSGRLAKWGRSIRLARAGLRYAKSLKEAAKLAEITPPSLNVRDDA
jgi:tetratricopeptide (TPR) repeat protein